ncbi:MAG: hypothetical protein H0V44_15810 [Planctomycetes bacterium]|nr:hypothetical protein [Planctomycetota bacterium]
MTALAIYLLMGIGPAVIIVVLAWIIAFEGTRHDRGLDRGDSDQPTVPPIR